MFEDVYEVYIKTDDLNNIIEVNSSAFLSDISIWFKIDEGYGDRFHHAQGNYFEKQIIDEYGRFNYRFINSVVEEIPESEKPEIQVNIPISIEQIKADIDYIAIMTGVSL